MIKFFLNLTKACYGSYSVEGNKIRRTFSWGFSYIAADCNSPEEAIRIVNDLNQLTRQ